MEHAVKDLQLVGLAAGLAAGIILAGAAYGISRLTSAGLESTARQPEAADNLWRAIIVPCALIEGLGIIGLGVCYFLAFIVFKG